MKSPEENKTALENSILGLDVGLKRVGVAISRNNVKTPVPYTTLSFKDSDKQILKLIHSEKISVVVIGLPLSETNTLTDQALSILKYARRIKRRSSVELSFVDEYASSKEAQERLSIFGGDIDSLSAAIILERFFSGQIIKEDLTSYLSL